MKTWLSVGLFLAVMFFDGIIFPALFGLKENFLTIIYLVAMLLYHEFSFQNLVLGIVFAGLAEFYWGLDTGILILPLLASAGTLFLLNRFFSIKSKILIILSGVVIFIVFWETSVWMTKIL